MVALSVGYLTTDGYDLLLSKVTDNTVLPISPEQFVTYVSGRTNSEQLSIVPVTKPAVESRAILGTGWAVVVPRGSIGDMWIGSMRR